MSTKQQPTSTITCPNPECRQLHGLFWRVSSATKRELVYRCAKIKYRKAVPWSANPEFRSVKKTLFAPDGTVPSENLPEEFTKGYKLEQKEFTERLLPMGA